MAYKTILLQVAIGLSLFFGCKTAKEDVHSIEKIENSLTPALVINGIHTEPLTLADAMKEHNVPAVSIAFFDNGSIQWKKTYGSTTSSNGAVIDDHTLFQAASISKPVSALGAMRLSQENNLDINEDLNIYLDEWKLQNSTFKNSDKATLKDILSHSGGITVSGFGGYDTGSQIPSLTQILNGEAPANSKPIIQDTTAGSLWRYSGGGFVILQKIMEDVSDIPFEEYMQLKVLTPMKMTSSTFAQYDPETNNKNIAIGHDGQGEPIRGKWKVHPEKAAAGLWTTPSDLALFAISIQKAYAGEKQSIVSESIAKKMLENQFDGWGLGMDISNKDGILRMLHGGSNSGYRCQLVAEANLGQGVVIMTNGDGGETVIQDLLRSISSHYNWNIYKPKEKTVITLSDTEKSKLIGRFSMSGNDQVVAEITASEIGLNVSQTWDGQSYLILPESESLFFRNTDGVPIEFLTNDTGEITGLIAGGELSFNKL